MKPVVYIFSLAICYALLEKAHFGWHEHAGSDSEMVCDGITIILFCMGFHKLEN